MNTDKANTKTYSWWAEEMSKLSLTQMYTSKNKQDPDKHDQTWLVTILEHVPTECYIESLWSNGPHNFPLNHFFCQSKFRNKVQTVQQ